MGARRRAIIATALGLALAGAGAPTAYAAAVVVTPAAPALGRVVTLRGSDFGRHQPAVVRLVALRARRVRTDAHGRFAVRLRVPSRARRGRHILVVQGSRRTVATSVRVVAPPPGRAALAVLGSGERFVLSALRARAGSRLHLHGTRLRAHARLSATLAGAALGAARTDARGRWRLVASVPAVPSGARQLTIRGRGVRLRLRFTVLAGPTTPPPALALPTPPAPAPLPRPTVTIAAAGDIACSPGNVSFVGGAGTASECRHAATANVIAALAPAAVLPLGDIQYEIGALDDFRGSYGPTWGRFDPIVHPVPGDAEYVTAGAAGYFAYFGARAGDPSAGYYSFDLGAWHLIALNSNCVVVACSIGSPQERWLRTDLAAHAGACTLAYWHRPRFTSGTAAQATATDPFWRALYEAGAEVVLGGHSHQYERFAPQTPDRIADAVRGIREFVVGTGGREHHAFATIRPNSEVRNADTFGVLALTLRAGGYDWRFVPEAGKTFTDAGSGSCH